MFVQLWFAITILSLIAISKILATFYIRLNVLERRENESWKSALDAHAAVKRGLIERKIAVQLSKEELEALIYSPHSPLAKAAANQFYSLSEGDNIV